MSTQLEELSQKRQVLEQQVEKTRKQQALVEKKIKKRKKILNLTNEIRELEGTLKGKKVQLAEELKKIKSKTAMDQEPKNQINMLETEKEKIIGLWSDKDTIFLLEQKIQGVKMRAIAENLGRTVTGTNLRIKRLKNSTKLQNEYIIKLLQQIPDTYKKRKQLEL